MRGCGGARLAGGQSPDLHGHGYQALQVPGPTLGGRVRGHPPEQFGRVAVHLGHGVPE